MKRTRLLRSIASQGWTTSNQLVCQFGHTTSALIRQCVKRGLLERRGTHNLYEYAITDAGRLELERDTAKRRTA